MQQTNLKLSHCVGQKFFPKWTMTDPINGNSSNSVKVLKAYILVTPNTPPEIITHPEVQHNFQINTPLAATNRAQTQEHKVTQGHNNTSQAFTPLMAAALARAHQNTAQDAHTNTAHGTIPTSDQQQGRK